MSRALLLLLLLVAAVVCVCVDAGAEAGVRATYQMRTLHTLARSSAGRLQPIRAARVRLQWESPPDGSVTLLALRLQCGDVRFESEQPGALALSHGAARTDGLSHAAEQISRALRRLSWFTEQEDGDNDHTSSASVDVLLHQLPTDADVAVAAAISGAAASTPGSRTAGPSGVSGGFGGWPEAARLCTNDASQPSTLDCCTVEVALAALGGADSHAVEVRRGSLDPLQPRNLELPRQSTASQALAAVPTSPSTRMNISEQLLDWKRVLHAVEAATPLEMQPPTPSTAHLPVHLPPTRAQRRAFLSQALRRKDLHNKVQRARDASSRPSSARAQKDRDSIISFVESAGWSSTSLADVLAGGVEPGMSHRTQAILAPTAEDSEAVGELMTDVTTTFLQATEQVHSHLRAGVGARQIIAIVCNKLVLKSMPPKVGLAIVKSLQQAVLNILKETIADQLTQYLVPPGGGESLIERGTMFRPMGQARMVQEAVRRVAQVNPQAALHLAKQEAERQREVVDEQHRREQLRRERMELIGGEGARARSTSFVEVNSGGHAAGAPSSSAPSGDGAAPPSSSSSSGSGDDDDKYASFLSTYSAARIRSQGKALTSGDRIAEKLVLYMTPMITNGVVHDTAAQTQNSLHVLLHESLSNKLHEDISKSLIDSLTPSLTTSISESQVELLSVTLRNQLTREATHVLTKSLTLILTPALSLVLTRSLTRSPHADYYCHLCNNPPENFPEKPALFHNPAPEGADPDKPYCLSCAQSKEHDFYLDYYSGYYSKYFSSYFAYYYGGHYARLAHEQVMGTCKTQPCDQAM